MNAMSSAAALGLENIARMVWGHMAVDRLLVDPTHRPLPKPEILRRFDLVKSLGGPWEFSSRFGLDPAREVIPWLAGEVNLGEAAMVEIRQFEGEPHRKRGPAIELPGPIGDLARAVGGRDQLAILLGTNATTIWRWAHTGRWPRSADQRDRLRALLLAQGLDADF